MKSHLVAAGALLAALALTPGAALAATDSFSGSCTIKDGVVELEQGVVAQNRDNAASFDIPLRCSGSANGKSIDGETGRLTSKVTGRIGCTGTSGTMSGTGTMRIGPAVVPVDFSFGLRGLNLTFRVAGRSSGKGDGTGEFPLGPNAGEMGRCTSTGLKRAQFDGRFRTDGDGIKHSTADATPTVSAPRLSFQRTQRSGTVLKAGGVRTRCTVSANGTCRVQVRRGSTVLASGIATGTAGRSVVVVARLTEAGRAALKSTGTVSATVRATSSGKSRSRRITFRR